MCYTLKIIAMNADKCYADLMFFQTKLRILCLRNVVLLIPTLICDSHTKSFVLEKSFRKLQILTIVYTDKCDKLKCCRLRLGINHATNPISLQYCYKTQEIF